MRYAINVPNGGPWGDARTLAGLAQLAEASGWDGVFLEDYIVWQGHQDTPTHDPWVTLAAIALRTERVRLGTMVTPLARRRPWKLARETVTLDHLSNGRLVLGVGLGDTGEAVGSDVSFTHFGEEMNPRRRARMLDEALDVLVGLWRGEPFSYAGEHYRVREVTTLPRPVQQPRIPIWIGGGWPLPGPTQRAARWDGACLYKHKEHYLAPEDVRALRGYVAAQRAADTPFDIAVGGSPRRDDWDEERAYIRALAAAGATWWVEYLPPETGSLDTVRASVARGPLRVD
jgi:alkanesulfonate monooxygenase SsuD/methylene tetrahydromethanopterin reductase-like flavin-dependent oxidoreductase (luciferase family)